MSITVGGVDIESRFGVMLTDESTFNPPPVKRCMLERPGGDGSLDVTEAFGDVLYGDREDRLVFLVDSPPSEFERVKTDVARFLHGRSYDYQLTSDPGYTYRGRFVVDEWYQQACFQKMIVNVYANPYKSAGTKVHTVDAQAGANVRLLPGRGRVRPVFESQMPCHVVANGVDVVLPPGSHTAVGLTIRDGASDVYVNTGGSIRGGTTTWGDLKARGLTWGDLKGKRWHEVMYMAGAPAPNEAYRVKIAYEVLEL